MPDFEGSGSSIHFCHCCSSNAARSNSWFCAACRNDFASFPRNHNSLDAVFQCGFVARRDLFGPRTPFLACCGTERACNRPRLETGVAYQWRPRLAALNHSVSRAPMCDRQGKRQTSENHRLHSVTARVLNLRFGRLRSHDHVLREPFHGRPVTTQCRRIWNPHENAGSYLPPFSCSLSDQRLPRWR
jgi:hypothetical protein